MKLFIGLLIGLVVGLGIGSGVTLLAAGGDESSTPDLVADATSDEEAPAEEEEAPAQEEAAPPALTPADFKIGVKVREKQCFGTAGCSITYRIDPQFVGAADKASAVIGHSYDLTYEVRGGESSVVNTMTIEEDGSFSFPSEETVDTAREGDRLTAVVTSVDPAA